MVPKLFIMNKKIKENKMKLFKDEVFNIPNYIEEHNKVLSKLDIDSLKDAIDLVVDAFQRGAKIITCGNTV